MKTRARLAAAFEISASGLFEIVVNQVTGRMFIQDRPLKDIGGKGSGLRREKSKTTCWPADRHCGPHR